LTLLVLTYYSEGHSKAYCSFDDFAKINKIGGWISIQYVDTTGTTLDVNLVSNGALNPVGNNMHIHQFGLDGWSASCNDAGGHYNPMVNYGEISGLYGTLNDTGMMTYMASMVKLDGDYNILGRSIVVHNSTGARVGCCTIALSDISGDITSGWHDAKVACREQNFTYSFDSANGNITNNLGDGVNYTAHVHKLGNCSNYQDIYYSFPTFTNGIQWSLANNTNIFGWAGRAIVRHNTSDLSQVLGCCQVIHLAAQTNINNTYVPTAASNTTGSTTGAATTTGATTTGATTTGATTTGATTGASTGKSTTSSSVNFVVSFLILFFFVLL